MPEEGRNVGNIIDDQTRESKEAKQANSFLRRTLENPNLNQYWYSAYTIDVLVKEIEDNASKAAFLSTPSLYFSLNDKQLKDNSYVFDVDPQWQKHPNFVRWDFNDPVNIPECMWHAFDLVLIDPPFITPEVWSKYAEATILLLAPGGKIILSTVQERGELLKQLLKVEPQVFEPSIPKLVYQYTLFANYQSRHLSLHNPEIYQH
ncbi:hypothetical protein KP509_03G017900 [Ceratopteris richardii]|uniref:Uncharacterized protein n=1 Tax=Ceratopteris richardii TaxID=49495 RepID=A0A8T2V1G2_CERRI|nr:hypothetical protein KP509_03G017900 [Ceratopteris richardii]